MREDFSGRVQAAKREGSQAAAVMVVFCGTWTIGTFAVGVLLIFFGFEIAWIIVGMATMLSANIALALATVMYDLDTRCSYIEQVTFDIEKAQTRDRGEYLERIPETPHFSR